MKIRGLSQGEKRVTHPRLILGSALLAALAAGCGGEAPTSTLITNVSIVDGTGAPARTGAVRIDGDRIVEVGDLEPKRREQVVDAGGSRSRRASLTSTATMRTACSRCAMPRRSSARASRRSSRARTAR